MKFSNINPTISKEDIKDISHIDLLSYYLNINKVPCVINSPLREDNHPSFSLFSKDGVTILYKDFSTNEVGDVYKLLSKYFNISIREVYSKIYTDKLKETNMNGLVYRTITNSNKVLVSKNNTDLDVVIRMWEDYDIEYWKSYGITIEALKYAEVYPISHKFYIKDNNRTLYKADKYAYAFIEHKDMKTTVKIYQPFNTSYKWTNKHDSSVLSLWTKIPEKGDKVIICSSLKDALCIWCNTNIPCISLQGEGYSMSNTAIKELYRRYKNIYILFDNDEAGIKYGKNLSETTGFKYIELPKINNQKDASDLYKSLEDKTQFKSLIINLLN